MTDREKLIAMLVEAMEEGEKECLFPANCLDCRAYKKYSRDECRLALSALYLVANGVVVREKGEWRNNKDDYPECTRCGYMPLPDFCPNCGADMRKGENG